MPDDSLKKACKELDGQMKGEVCIVDGYPMSDSGMLDSWAYYVDDDWKDFSLELWEPEEFMSKGDMGWMHGPYSRSRSYAIRTGEGREDVLPSFNKDSLEKLKDRLEEGKPIDPPWVVREDAEYVEDLKEVVSHEGRHRALACLDSEDCERLPVVIQDK